MSTRPSVAPSHTPVCDTLFFLFFLFFSFSSFLFFSYFIFFPASLPEQMIRIISALYTALIIQSLRLYDILSASASS